MLQREVPVWVAALVVVLVLVVAGVIYWRLSVSSVPSQPPTLAPGVPVTAQPPGRGGPMGPGPMPATGRPGEQGTPTTPLPPSTK